MCLKSQDIEQRDLLIRRAKGKPLIGYKVLDNCGNSKYRCKRYSPGIHKVELPRYKKDYVYEHHYGIHIYMDYPFRHKRGKIVKVYFYPKDVMTIENFRYTDMGNYNHIQAVVRQIEIKQEDWNEAFK